MSSRKTPGQNPTLVLLIVLTVALLVGGHLVRNGLIAGLLVFASVWVLVGSFPWIKDVIRVHPRASDLIVTVGTYILSPVGGITGMVAAASVGVLFSIFIRGNLDIPRSGLKKLRDIGNSFLEGIEDVETDRGTLDHRQHQALSRQNGKEET